MREARSAASQPARPWAVRTKGGACERGSDREGRRHGDTESECGARWLAGAVSRETSARADSKSCDTTGRTPPATTNAGRGAAGAAKQTQDSARAAMRLKMMSMLESFRVIVGDEGAVQVVDAMGC